MQIPFVDLKAQYNSIRSEIDTAINNVIADTSFIGGKYVKIFDPDLIDNNKKDLLKPGPQFQKRLLHFYNLLKPGNNRQPWPMH